MQIETHRKGAVSVLEPLGPIIQDDAEQFASRLEETARTSLGRMLIDVSHVPFVDSRGLEVFADAAADLSETGQTLRLCGANETLRTVFELTELDSLFDHYQDVNAAVRSFL